MVSTNEEAFIRLSLLNLKLLNGKDARTWHVCGHFMNQRPLCPEAPTWQRNSPRWNTHQGWSQWGESTRSNKSFLEELQSEEYAKVAEEGGDVVYLSRPIGMLGPA